MTGLGMLAVSSGFLLLLINQQEPRTVPFPKESDCNCYRNQLFFQM